MSGRLLLLLGAIAAAVGSAGRSRRTPAPPTSAGDSRSAFR